ncbi:MAG: FecR domain-containing protein [Mangrovibacterium sp.]|nr:FecR domain-containing protein [Mangrovibacterium sp.]
MNKEILTKYLKNRCSEKEFEQLATWIEEETWKKEGMSWGFDHWKMAEPDAKKKDERKYSALLDQIHDQINLAKRSNEGGKLILLTKMARWLNQAAAVLFVPLLGVVFYLLLNRDVRSGQLTNLTVDSLEVIAPVGSRTVVQLSDGSEVSLNYGSKIKYPRMFAGDRREITLSGEGYFQVAHNPEKPFVVKTGKLNIKALGTTFNVQSYPGDAIISTTLVEGKVVLEKAVPGKTDQQIETLVPGQHVSYSPESGRVVSTMNNIDQYIAWKDGKLVFDNAPIQGVAERLERMFNVEIEVADAVKEFSYTVTFLNDPLYLILDLMTQTTPITYRMLPRVRQADGSYSKQKIRIEKRT